MRLDISPEEHWRTAINVCYKSVQQGIISSMATRRQHICDGFTAPAQEGGINTNHKKCQEKVKN